MQEWTMRLSIAMDIAKALNYIHSDLVNPLVHYDLKSSDILLNYAFMGKLGDFGLAREVGGFGHLVSMSNVQGLILYSSR